MCLEYGTATVSAVNWMDKLVTYSSDALQQLADSLRKQYTKNTDSKDKKL